MKDKQISEEAILRCGSLDDPQRDSTKCRNEVNKLVDEVKARRKLLKKKRAWNKTNARNDFVYLIQYIKKANTEHFRVTGSDYSPHLFWRDLL